MTRVIEGKHSPGSRQPLTIRQRIFVEAYIADPMHSGKAAAIEAGYSQRRAHVTAHRLLRKRHVRAAIDRALRPQLRKYRITRARVLRELAVLAFSDILDYRITGDGQIELTGGASTRATRAVSVFRCRRSRTTRGNGDQAVTTEIQETEVRFWDKGRALALAMQYLGLLVDRVQIEDTPATQSDEELRQSILDKLERLAATRLSRSSQRLAC